MRIEEKPARVFCAHPVEVDLGNGRKRWKFDTQRIIGVYGELVTLLDDSREMLNYESAVDKIAANLKVARFDPERDYFLAAGDMTAYAAMVMVSHAAFGITPRQLRHTRTPFDRYDVLPACGFTDWIDSHYPKAGASTR